MRLSTDPDAFYSDTLEPLFGPLNEPKVDFAALRTNLPKSNDKTTKRTAIFANDTVSIQKTTLRFASFAGS